MQLNMGLTVNADDTVDGQLLLTAQKSVLSGRNKNLPVAFAELRQNIPALPAGEETLYQDATFYGSQISYRKAPLAGFDTESVKLVRDGDLYRFTLPLDPKKYGGKVAEQNPQNQQAFLKLMSFEISVTFPGRVIDSNGTVNGRSVSWKVDPNQEKPSRAAGRGRGATTTVHLAGRRRRGGRRRIPAGCWSSAASSSCCCSPRWAYSWLRRRHPAAPAAPGPTPPPGPPAGAPGPG